MGRRVGRVHVPGRAVVVLRDDGVFCYPDPGTYYSIKNYGSTLYLYRTVDGSTTTLQAISLGTASATEVRVRVRTVDEGQPPLPVQKISVWADGTQKLKEYPVRSPTIADGGFGFPAPASSTFDSVKIGLDADGVIDTGAIIYDEDFAASGFTATAGDLACDHNGNLTQGPGFSYKYDAWNRLST